MPSAEDQRVDALAEPMRHLRRGFLIFLRVECGLLPATLEAYSRDLDALLLDLQRAGASGLSTPNWLRHRMA